MGVAEGVVEVLESDVVEVVAVVAVVEVVKVVGPVVIRQEHPDDTLEAGYWDT